MCMCLCWYVGVCCDKSTTIICHVFVEYLNRRDGAQDRMCAR